MKTAIFIPSYSLRADGRDLTAIGREAIEEGLKIAQAEKAEGLIISAAYDRWKKESGPRTEMIARSSFEHYDNVWIVSGYKDIYDEAFKLMEICTVHLGAKRLIIVAERCHGRNIQYLLESCEFPDIELVLKTFRASRFERAYEANLVRAICTSNTLLWRVWNIWVGLNFHFRLSPIGIFRKL